MPLSAEQVAQYQRDGYVCPVPVMPAAEALALRGQLEAYEATQGGKLQAAQRSRARPSSSRGANPSSSSAKRKTAAAWREGSLSTFSMKWEASRSQP